MKLDMVVWLLLFLASMYSIYTFSTPLFLYAILFVVLFSSSLYLTKMHFRNYVKIFFVLIFVILAIVLLCFKNDLLLFFFTLGIVIALLALVPFKALPDINGWTKGEATVKYRNWGFHHWFAGSLIMLFFVFVLPCFAGFPLFSWVQALLDHNLVATLLGFGMFWFTSQIPEILSRKSAFPISFEIQEHSH